LNALTWNNNNNNRQSNNSSINSSNFLGNNLLLMQKANSSVNQNSFQLNQHIQQQQPATCSLNNTLFVGNLHASLQENDLIQVFRPFGNIVECCKKWLHFGFVKFVTEEEACHAYVTLNGFRLKGRPMRLEFQNRAKKSKIKAIIAQAGLSSSANQGLQLNSDLFGAFNSQFQLNDERQVQQQFNNFNNHHQNTVSSFNATNSNSLKNSSYYQTASLLECLNKKFDSSTNNDNTINNIFGAGSTSTTNSTSNTFINTDQLIKFANSIDIDKPNLQIPQFEFNFDFSDSLLSDNNNKSNKNDEMLLNLVKKTISPINSPQHDLSGSSDSGCRSASFIGDCDDSAIISTVTSTTTTQIKNTKNTNLQIGSKISEQFLSVEKQTILSQKQHLVSDEISISEHMEFTCSNTNTGDNNNQNELRNKKVNEKISEEVEECNDENDEVNEQDDDDCDSDCDTSDDASELPLDSECLNDLDFEYNDLNGDENGTVANTDATNKYIQVMEKDGSMARKKLNYGCIYRSINQTMSLFIEPHDVLKQMDSDEYDEYILFPNEDIETSYSNYIDENLLVNGSNTELVESLQLVIKNHFYL